MRGKTGRPAWNTRTEADIRAHIQSKIVVTATGCWEWQGNRQFSGYGQVNYLGHGWPVHKLMYTLNVAEVPKGKVVCHTCDNPPCCNPAHLWIGTTKDNMQDSSAKGRQPRRAQTHCKNGHAYAEHGRNYRGHNRCRICTRVRLRVLAGWPLDKALSLPKTSPGRRPVGAYFEGPVNSKPKTHCVNGHEFNAENTYIPPGTKWRRCRKCQQASTYRGYQRLAEKRRSSDAGTAP